MVFLVASSWLLVTIVEDIINELGPLNSDEVLYRHERELTEHLNKIVQLHTDVKQLSQNIFSNLNFRGVHASSGWKNMDGQKF